MRGLRFVSMALIALMLWSVATSMDFSPVRADTVYNARSVVDVQWNLNETEKPIVPRDEFKRLTLKIAFRIDTGESFGQGLYDGYKGTALAFIDLEVNDSSPWCSAAISPSTVATNISRYSETTTDLYLTLDETAPAYGDGFISIKATSRALSLIEGFEDTFDLYFVPSYLPIIAIDLPESNSKRAGPMETIMFPITIENRGNARTKVFFEVSQGEEDWITTVTDELTIPEASGSTGTAYLTIVPSNDFGYHLGDAVFTVSILPTRAENTDERGKPLYATFIVQNRGFSTMGIEAFIPIGLIVLIIIIGLLLFFKYKWRDFAASWKAKERKPGLFTSKRRSKETTSVEEKGPEPAVEKRIRQPLQRLKSLRLKREKEETKPEKKAASQETSKGPLEGLSKAFTSFRKKTLEPSETQPEPKEKTRLFQKKTPVQDEQPMTITQKKTKEIPDAHPERDRALLRIKRQQEKQKKKFMKSSS